MAALAFPQSPSVNDIFTSGTRSWKWTGSRWAVIASPISPSRLSGEGAEIGDVLSFDGENYSPVPIAAGSATIANSAADVFTSTSGEISADDPGADRIIFWDDSASKLTHLEIGTGLEISGTTLNNTGGLTGTGSVDNAILRADGTGGSTLQSSGLLVEDAIVSFTGITGDAATDIITATGHNLVADQPVRFTALTGGSGLNTTTNYFVRDISGSTFKVSTTSGGAAVNFTTNITAGTLLTGHSVQTNVTLSENTTETNSALVLTPKGTGAFILGPKPDGTATGGNARGTRAVDLQTSRTAATQVANGTNSVICGGLNNTNNSQNSFLGGGSGCNISGGNGDNVIGGGQSNASSSTEGAFIGGGSYNSANGTNSVVCGGGSYNGLVGNTASAARSAILGGLSGLADRQGQQSHANGRFAAQGDAQRARFVLRNKTTTNAAVELFLDGSANRLTIPSGKIFAFTINISGVKSDGSAVAHYLRQYALKNVAGTCTEVYAPVTIGTDNAAGTSIALSAYDVGATEALKVEVTGTASTIWRWVASVDAVEIAYGT